MPLFFVFFFVTVPRVPSYVYINPMSYESVSRQSSAQLTQK
jgi:hypothetical protein